MLTSQHSRAASRFIDAPSSTRARIRVHLAELIYHVMSPTLDAYSLDGAPTPVIVPGDSSDEIARDVASIGRIEALPTILEVLCELTGMRFAAVARVTESTWTACAVKDAISFGLPVGGSIAGGEHVVLGIEAPARADRDQPCEHRF